MPPGWRHHLAASILAALAGVLSGLASAFFLWTLDLATATRAAHPALLFGLPMAGLLIGALYARFGGEAGKGYGLILDRIHEGGGPVPFRMAPMILGTSVLTHLFGGSAGREGTAVQMGGTLADLLTKPLRLDARARRVLLLAGVAGGFGSVFGTPVAGAVFALEALALGRVESDALLPCLVAGVAGDLVCRGIGIRHYAYAAATDYSLSALAWTFPAALLFGAASAAFVELTHALAKLGKSPYARPVVGGFAVIALTLAVGSQDYNGLGLPLVERAFRGEVPPYAFALKLLFTAVTLGAGFKGGEVTPLFAIGATLGSAFAALTHQDPALFAALGFVAVFAGAANTPLACAIMGVELFGARLAVPMALASAVAYLVSGHRGIYPAQRIHRSKDPTAEVPEGTTLEKMRNADLL